MPKRIFQTAFDTYEGGHELGSGGTGFVVEAIAASSRERLAIKVFNPPNWKHAADTRFRNEMIFGEKASHKNVVAVLDRGVIDLKDGPAPFYVMRLYPQTLRKIMAARPDPKVALSIFAGMLDGVECAHLRSVWHRDLKPENILASAQDEIVVADFGAAHFGDLAHYEAAETSLHDRLANFRYCAPEQADRSAQVDQTVDIYALGLMLNEMFTSEVIRGSSPAKIASVAPGFGYLDALVERMTKQRPAERFQSIAAVKTEFSDLARIQVARQRVDQFTQTVARDDGPDDPILRNPLRIIDHDWKSDRLILKLSSPVPTIWKQLFHVQKVGMSMNSLPRAANWVSADTFSIPANERDAAAVYAAYEQQVAQINNDYALRLRSDYQQKMAAEANQREAERKEAEKRARVLEKLKRP